MQSYNVPSAENPIGGVRSSPENRVRVQRLAKGKRGGGSFLKNRILKKKQVGDISTWTSKSNNLRPRRSKKGRLKRTGLLKNFSRKRGMEGSTRPKINGETEGFAGAYRTRARNYGTRKTSGKKSLKNPLHHKQGEKNEAGDRGSTHKRRGDIRRGKTRTKKISGTSAKELLGGGALSGW